MVALQLDDWREKNELQERINKAFSNVDEELKANKEGLENIIGANNYFIGILEFIVDHQIDEGLIEFNPDELSKLFPDQVQNLQFLQIDSTKKPYSAKVDVIYNMFLSYRIKDQNWEGLKYSGYLSLSNREDLSQYVLTYELLNIGGSDYDLLDATNRLTTVNTNEERLQILQENTKRYESKLNYLNRFFDEKQAGNKQ